MTPFAEDVLEELGEEPRAALTATLANARFISFIHADEAYFDQRPAPRSCEHLNTRVFKPNQVYWIEYSRACGCLDAIMAAVNAEGVAYCSFVNHSSPACTSPGHSRWYEHPEPLFITLRGDQTRVSFMTHTGRTVMDEWLMRIVPTAMVFAAERMRSMA